MASNLSTRLQLAIRQIEDARAHTIRLLDQIHQDDWFRMPTEGVTHIAWQVGHLAMAEYRLTLERIRGIQPGDDEVVSPTFLALFVRGTVPEADASVYPSPEELRRVFDRVHAQTLAELPGVPDAVLDQPPETPHPLFNTRMGALLWCGQHEMVHAGQIGLLRRLLGAKPLW